MSQFEVWAPEAESVKLVVGRGSHHGEHPMEKFGRGYWRIDLPVASCTDYGFLVNGEGPFPDPRSPMQPSGVHGLSRTVDHSSYGWRSGDFRASPLASGVIYELHVGTFTEAGTFEAAIEQLDHLRELGISHVEVMPINSFPGNRGWGYDGVALFAPQASYGGHEGFKRFVDACHLRGLAVILDVVYNHLGPSGNYLGKYGPYLTNRYLTPWGPSVNLDGPGSDEVRRFFIDNALMWLRDYRVDGLRLDAIHAFVDNSARHFLEELACAVKNLERQVGRPLCLIAESDLNDPKVVRSQEAFGYGMDAQCSDDFHHALHVALTRECDGYYQDFRGLEALAKALRQAFVLDGQYVESRDRRHGRIALGVPPSRFLGYAQNHDQVGNRARGERLSQLVDVRKQKMAAALVLLSPFVPMLFQGEEWGAASPFCYFTDHDDPELAEAVRKGRRDEFAGFGWRPEDIPDPQAPETFASSKLNWQEKAREPHREVFDWYKQLIALRASEPALRKDEFPRVACDETLGWLELERDGLVAVFNFSDEELALATLGKKPWTANSCFMSSARSRREDVLAPWSISLFRQSR